MFFNRLLVHLIQLAQRMVFYTYLTPKFYLSTPMRPVLAVILLCLSATMAVGQYVENYTFERQPTIIKFGVGYGLDYGGLGARFTITPVPKIGVFGAFGYNFHKAAYNVGANYKFLPDKRVTPVVGVMYGYNAVIVVEGTDQYNKTYNGVSISGGIELNMRKSKNYWSFEMTVAFWSKAYRDDWEALKNNPGVVIDEGYIPIPIDISVGYHFNI